MISKAHKSDAVQIVCWTCGDLIFHTDVLWVNRKKNVEENSVLNKTDFIASLF
jgi:hypothetical protein